MMHIDGQCHCGHVSYEADIDPEEVSICHCTDCQVFSGSAFRVTVRAKRENVRLTGEPKAYAKIGSSGNVRLQYFCPECGSALFATGQGDAAAILGLRWGSIAQRGDLTPRQQIWCRSAAPWIGDIPNLPGKETV